VQVAKLGDVVSQSLGQRFTARGSMRPAPWSSARPSQGIATPSGSLRFRGCAQMVRGLRDFVERVRGELKDQCAGNTVIVVNRNAPEGGWNGVAGSISCLSVQLSL